MQICHLDFKNRPIWSHWHPPKNISAFFTLSNVRLSISISRRNAVDRYFGSKKSFFLRKTFSNRFHSLKIGNARSFFVYFQYFETKCTHKTTRQYFHGRMTAHIVMFIQHITLCSMLVWMHLILAHSYNSIRQM